MSNDTVTIEYNARLVRLEVEGDRQQNYRRDLLIDLTEITEGKRYSLEVELSANGEWDGGFDADLTHDQVVALHSKLGQLIEQKDKA